MTTHVSGRIVLPTMNPRTALQLHIERQGAYGRLTSYYVLVQLYTYGSGSSGRSSRDVLVFAKLDWSAGSLQRKVVEMMWPQRLKMRLVTAHDLALWLDSERVTRLQKNRILPELRKAVEVEINKLQAA